MECGILGNYVWQSVSTEARAALSGKATHAAGGVVAHAAHLGGAVAGVALVLLLSRLPPE